MKPMAHLAGYGGRRGAIIPPNEIASLTAWWAPDSMVGSPNLTSWTDKSGNGRTLTPQGSNPGINVGGAPGGVLNAVDIDCKSVSGNERLETAASPLNLTNHHTFLVVRIDNWAAQNTVGFLFYGDNTGGTSSKVPVGHTGTTGALATGTWDGGPKEAVWSSTVDPAAGSWGLVESFWESGIEIGINVDNGTPVSTAVGTITAPYGDIDNFSVSNNGVGNEGFDATWAEIIVFAARLTTPQRPQVIAYLVDKYGAIGTW